jgi:DNA-binding transcriptional regulator YhcF (GntR family)
VTLELPRRVVADLLGMRAETLSRALAELVQRGATATTRTTLRIVDSSALAMAAGRCARG